MEIIKLDYPIKHDDQTISEVEIRRPNVRDHIWLDHQSAAAKRSGKTFDEVEKDAELYARLCDLSVEAIGKLDMQDWGKLRKFYLECVVPSKSSTQETETA
ncbi:phage tail assembly protein [Vibrio coralliilyticus]|uniref:phage tail assembly protein n=1 Tax=Vibrio coralliilyticus TaxID=190893 RepID=UPI0002D40BFB|nr:phage tail assembly protein [Vibrio coralliilyticus]